MKRSEFIKNTTILGLGLGLSPNLLFGQPKNTYKIGIIGAGLTGLHLGKSLKEKGHEVYILEAKNRAGGRILQDSLFHSSPIDLGAQWIHGKNELYKLVKQSRETIYKDTKNELIKILFKGNLLDDFPPEFYQLIKEIDKKTPLKEDISVLNFAKNINTDPDFISLLENVVTDTATSANNLSINEISKLTQYLYLTAG